jgi:hypothetical protein
MDEFHILPEQFAEMNKSLERFVKVTKEAAEQAKKILNAYFGILEPYMLYELRDPKKKPRGSIRRNKRNEREKKRNSLNRSTLYIDDIYDIMYSKDNK